ncbi:MAG: acetamidase/formamidase family protein [Solirubrobacteraceae bacterium]
MAGSGHPHSIHSVGSENAAFVWDNAAAPVLEIESGEVVQLECADASGGQLGAQSTAEDVKNLDLSRVNPVTGPVYVKTAQPGDVLQIEILELTPKNWGWTAIIPGFGLLADEYPDPWLNISQVDPATGSVQFADGITLPFQPFPGTIGLAPAEPGQHSVVPPSKWGGNMDIKHLRPGTTLYLPVAVPGALFSVGDTHAAMGDGEVCGTAVETAMDITVRLSVRTDISARYPQYSIPAGPPAATTQTSYHVCTGIGPDLMEATREATRALVDHIAERYGRSRQEAYAIASVAADLRNHEVVDVPNWVVGAFLPEAIFTT